MSCAVGSGGHDEMRTFDVRVRDEIGHIYRLRTERGEPLRPMHFTRGHSTMKAEVLERLMSPGHEVFARLTFVPSMHRGADYDNNDRAVNPHEIRWQQ